MSIYDASTLATIVFLFIAGALLLDAKFFQ